MFGPPQQLVTDEGRAWLGHDFENWTSVHGVDHIVAPGEPHERLALVERRHAVLRKAIEVYLDDLKLDHAGHSRGLDVLCSTAEHAQSTDGDLMEDSDHEMAPPRQRPRLLPPLPASTAMPDTV